MNTSATKPQASDSDNCEGAQSVLSSRCLRIFAPSRFYYGIINNHYLLPLLLISLLTPLALAAETSYHADHVLGTSLDLIVDAPDQPAADRFRDQVNQEITRLSSIISTYDPKSEISSLTLNQPKPASPELIELLGLYDTWEQRTSGALSGRLGDVIQLWKDAGKSNQLPAPSALQDQVERAAQPAWKVNPTDHTIIRTSSTKLNVDAVGKAYIIDKAMLSAEKACPEVKRAMLNIGGEIVCLGEWTVEVADPEHAADNEPPLLQLKLNNQAIATSGSSARYVTIQGKRYSHILDPKTGQSVDIHRAASVVANDCATANALATPLCVLPWQQGLAIVQQTPGASALVVDNQGQPHTSANWSKLVTAPATTAPAAQSNPNWPAGYAVHIKLTLPQLSQVQRYRRPYVAAWITDDQGKAVRTLALWGNKPKYWPHLSTWRAQVSAPQADLARVSRATRGPGEYQLLWDGKTDAGAYAKAGTYTIHVEVAREHGGHDAVAAQLPCLKQPAQTQAKGKSELGDVSAEFSGSRP